MATQTTRKSLSKSQLPNRKLYRGEAYGDSLAHVYIGNIFWHPETKCFHIYPGHPAGGLLSRLDREFHGTDFRRLPDLKISTSSSVERYYLAGYEPAQLDD